MFKDWKQVATLLAYIVRADKSYGPYGTLRRFAESTSVINIIKNYVELER